MSRTLVICEKPSVAADVSKALAGQHSFTKTGWGYESSQMLVAAAAGHLVESLPPEKYNETWKEWSFEQLPIIPDRFMYQPRDSRAAERLRTIRALICDPDVTTIVNACDAGREGELIFKLILQFARLPQPKVVERAWFASMTAGALQQAFTSLRPDRDMQPLEAAARCRAEADWVVGMNATRAASTTLGGRQMLSMGRVQTPTLALIVRRDLEIDGFVPADYYGIKATFTGQDGTWVGTWRASKDGDATERFDDKAAAAQVAANTVAAGKGVVDTVDVRAEDVMPPKLFDLTDLQREANKKFGFTATKTLELAQACYETHKVLSYPRTDSRYLTSDMKLVVADLVARVLAADTAMYQDIVTAVQVLGCDATRIIDDNKVNDHHGLVPTDAAHNLQALSVDERSIYDLVCHRFLAALLSPQRLERTTVWTVAKSGESESWYRTAGRRVLDIGWRLAWPEAEATTKGKKKTEVEDDDDATDATDDAGDLPQITEGETPTIDSVEVTEHTTKPPPRYTEASLLGAMATAGKLVTDDDMAEAMKDSGLGTPATRASIVETLMKREYLERSGRKIMATAKGRGLIMALGDHPLASPDLTGSWEKRLKDLEKCNPDDAPRLRSEFDTAVRRFVTQIVSEFEGRTPDQMAVGRKKIADCPVPGCAGIVVDGKRAWGCDTYRSAAEPGCGLVIWKEQSGKKVTEKELMGRLADVAAGKTIITPPVERVEIAPCPSAGCEGTISERPKSWGCSSWKSPTNTGCGFVIWKSNPDGTTVTDEQALVMIASGATNAKPKPIAFAPCPRCKGELVDKGKMISCNSWSPSKPGCGTTIWKTGRDDKVLTDDEIRAAIEACVGTKAPSRKKSPAKKAAPRR